VVREDSKEVVRTFKRMGLRVVMVTGDREEVASAVAREVGISEVYAEVKPEDKLRIVEKLQEEGEKVAFVGDGINDAPAMARAFLGIAVGSGSDITVRAGEVVLARGGIELLKPLWQLSRKAKRKMKENIFWAFLYNVFAIPVAAGLFYPYVVLRPEIGAIAMSVSDIIVVLNALSLKRWKAAA